MVDRIQFSVKGWLDETTIRLMSVNGSGSILAKHPVRIVAKRARYGHYVMVSVSLPKLMRGHNITDLTFDETVEAFNRIDEFIRPIRTELGLPDVRQWNVSSVEFSKTFTVHDPNWAVQRGWHSMRENDAKRFVPNFGPQGCTVTWLGRTFKYMAYNKQAETAAKAGKNPNTLPDDWADLSAGKLRMEHVSGRPQLRRTVLKNKASVDDLLSYLEIRGDSHVEETFAKLLGFNPFVMEH